MDFSVKDAGATGDAKQVGDAVTISGSNIVTSATANFQNSDVGKVVFVTLLSNQTPLAMTTITSRTNATTITVGLAATISATGGNMVWGSTNDSSAFLSAWNAAYQGPASSYGAPSYGPLLAVPGRVIMPAGGYIIGGTIFSRIVNQTAVSVLGEGSDRTVLFVAPGQAAPLMIFSGNSGTYKGFTVDGNGQLVSSSNDLIKWINVENFQVSDINVIHFGVSSLDLATVRFQAAIYGQIDRMLIQNPGNLIYDFCGAVTARDVFVSNGYRNLRILNSTGRTPTSVPLTILGGGADESGDALNQTTIIGPSAGVNVIGAVFFSQLTVQSGAQVYLTDCNIGKFNTNVPGPALVIQPGAKVVMRGTTLRAVNDGTYFAKAVHNLGTLVDAGGNDVKTCNFSVCTSQNLIAMTTGNLPVRY